MSTGQKYLLDTRTERTYLRYMLNNDFYLLRDEPGYRGGEPGDDDGDYFTPEPDPDFDAMTDEQFEKYLAEKRATEARKAKAWMELVNREVRR